MATLEQTANLSKKFLTVLLLTIGNLIWSSMTEIKWLTCGDKTVLHAYKSQKVTFKMGKLRQWFRNWFDIQIEKSLQRKSNRMFDKNKVKYTDGDNT
jgi:hypothetical protein